MLYAICSIDNIAKLSAPRWSVVRSRPAVFRFVFASKSFSVFFFARQSSSTRQHTPTTTRLLVSAPSRYVSVKPREYPSTDWTNPTRVCLSRNRRGEKGQISGVRSSATGGSKDDDVYTITRRADEFVVNSDDFTKPVESESFALSSNERVSLMAFKWKPSK